MEGGPGRQRHHRRGLGWGMARSVLGGFKFASPDVRRLWQTLVSSFLLNDFRGILSILYFFPAIPNFNFFSSLWGSDVIVLHSRRAV